MRDPRLPSSIVPNDASSSARRLDPLPHPDPRIQWISASTSSRSQQMNSPAHGLHQDYPSTSRGEQQQQYMEPRYSQNPSRDQQYRPSPPQPSSHQSSPPQYYSLSPPEAIPRSVPPAPVHRVYVLNCATCDNFLTNRGMRAVLLLKPHIVLFSTDAAPCNAETSWPDESIEEEHVERTCDCLTSSIACHGCGRIVGYHIVAPCSKCTDSVQKHQRSANHHRFVFHHNEVSSKERTYYPGERGVHNPVIASMVVPRTRTPSPAPAPVVPRRRVSIYDVEKDLLDSRLAPQIAPSPPRRQSPPPSQPPNVTLLKAGDVLYWHHLVSGGERSKPTDPRTREPIWTQFLGR